MMAAKILIFIIFLQLACFLRYHRHLARVTL